MAKAMDSGYEFASLVSRVVGTVIDGAIAAMLYLLGIYVLNQLNSSNWLTITSLIFFVYVVYFTWPIHKYATTPGFKLMKLKVVNSDGTNLGIVPAFLRYVAKTLLSIISIVTYGFTPKRQTLHDIIVDSIVIKEITSAESLSIEALVEKQARQYEKDEKSKKMKGMIRGWVLLSYLGISLILSVIVTVAIWPDWLDQDPSPPLPEACWGLIWSGMLLIMLLDPLQRAGLSVRSLFLSKAPPREAKWAVAVAFPLVAVSVGLIYALYLPLSYFYPSFVQWWIIEDPMVMIWTTGKWHALANVLNFVAIVGAGPIVEEILFRGLLLPTWAMRWGTSRAVLFSSLLFALLHADLLGGFVFGVITALAYLRTRQLLIPILIHMANNGLVWILMLAELAIKGPGHQYTLAEFQSEWWTGAVGLALGIPWLVGLVKSRQLFLDVCGAMNSKET